MTDAIVPDDKDWTWVLERPCPECGFAAGSIAPSAVAALVRDSTDRWIAVLDTPVEHLRARPDPSRWTTLEYAAHVRDVLRLYRTRLALMVDADDPLFANWDQDETARDERYNEQDPSVVALELQDAGAALADAFDAIDGDRWQRRGRRSDGASFTIATFAQYMIHDPIHHLWDVDAQL
jgi:DinB superfamily